MIYAPFANGYGEWKHVLQDLEEGILSYDRYDLVGGVQNPECLRRME
jgi:hypothetical protein